MYLSRQKNIIPRFETNFNIGKSLLTQVNSADYIFLFVGEAASVSREITISPTSGRAHTVRPYG